MICTTNRFFSFSLNRVRGTVLTAVPAMKTMIPINPVWHALLNASLRAYCRAGAASHAGVRNVVSLLFYTGIYSTKSALCRLPSVSCRNFFSRCKKIDRIRFIVDRADIPYLRKGICGCADLRLFRLAILPTLLCANGFMVALAC